MNKRIQKLQKILQEQIADFVTANSKISRESFEHYMMATGEMATDVGTIFSCNTQSIPAKKWLHQAENPSPPLIFPVFR